MPERTHTHVCQHCGNRHGHNDKMHQKHYCGKCKYKCNCRP